MRRRNKSKKSSCRQKRKGSISGLETGCHRVRTQPCRKTGRCFVGALRRGIPVPSRRKLRMMREDTLPWLEQSVLARVDTWKSVNFPESLTQWLSLSKDEKSFIATSLVQMTRYTWLGYDKHLYFTVIPDRNGNTSLFFRQLLTMSRF